MTTSTLRRRGFLAAVPSLLVGACRESRAPRPAAASPNDASDGDAADGADGIADSEVDAPSGHRTLVPFNRDDLAFLPDEQHFKKKGSARPGDWLARFHEPDISFLDYCESHPVTPTDSRNVIVIQPLGVFDDAERAYLERLRSFMAEFFDSATEIAKPVALSDRGFRKRHDGARPWTQYRTGLLIDRVLRPLLPGNAICLLGVTMADLYPDESWNYVFGEATLEKRVGVYSLVRYFPAFWGAPDTPQARLRALRRGYKVLSHETGHMFSVTHCVRYECVMNGSNSLEEMDQQPSMLCPECLKKLAWNLEFDVRKRYRGLRDIYAMDGLHDLVQWIDTRLAKIGGAKSDVDCAR